MSETVAPVTGVQTAPAQATQLHRGALGLVDVLFQAITHMGPSVSVVFLFPLIALNAGAAMPISLALAVLVGLVIANTVAEFSATSRRVAAISRSWAKDSDRAGDSSPRGVTSPMTR